MQGYAASTQKAPESTEELFAWAEQVVKELADLEDYYFAADKESKLSKVSSLCCEALTAFLAQSRPLPAKSRALYLKGRAASYVPGQERVAEEHLSKAIKLDPKLLDAWNALGEVYWNLQDVGQAARCFEQALELCEPNDVSLRNLSMALRAIDGGQADGKSEDAAKVSARRLNYAKALEKAKEAVVLGPEDPLNWETLGNAYVGNFFVNAKRPDEIKRALIAYEKSDLAYQKLGKWNPSLHFNRGMAAKYVEDYDLALRCFAKAQELGATGAADQRRKVIDLIEQLSEHLEKADVKSKKLKDLTQFPPGNSYRNLKDLQAARRPSDPVAVKVVALLKRQGEVPVILVCCDAAGEFVVLSLYNADLQKLEQALVPMRTLLAVSQASYRQISVTAPRQLSYPCVIVGNPVDVSILSGASPGAGSSLACAAGGPTVFSTAAERSLEAPESSVAASGEPSACETLAQCQEILIAAAREAAGREGRGAVLRALVPQLRVLLDKELGPGAGARLQRVEAMLERMGRGEVFQDENEDGKRYAPGFIEGLEPRSPFHVTKAYPWAQALRKHWTEIQAELQANLDTDVWVPGIYAKQYAPEWKIASVFMADHWEEGRFPKTQRILKRLSVQPFEIFFAQMPPKTKILEHSDNQNYILTLHLGLLLEQGKCSLQVGQRKRDWEEGQAFVFDTTFIHSATNDSSRSRYVLVLRFWHPNLSKEERRAVQISHLLLAGTPDPEKAKREAELWGRH